MNGMSADEERATDRETEPLELRRLPLWYKFKIVF